MIIGHLPASYCLVQSLPRPIPYALPLALLAAVLPDFDLALFFFVDQGAFHHHYYWVHIPLFWVAVMAIALPVAAALGCVAPALVFFAAIFLLLIADTIVGGIMWAAPFDTALYRLVEVPATRSYWLWSVVFHWTFLLDIAVTLAAAGLLVRRHGRAILARLSQHLAPPPP